MTETPQPLLSHPIAQDLPCQTCGYNLRGLRPNGRCPECGASVADSNRPDLLEFANPDWLAKVKLGADILFYSIIVGVFGGLVLGCVGVAFSVVQVIPIASIQSVTSGLSVAGSIVHVVAVFLLTTQEPRLSLIEERLTWRSFIRIAVIVGVGVQVMLLLAKPTGIYELIWMAMVIGLISGPIVSYAEFAYAASFARRIPDPSLFTKTNIVKWGMSSLTLLTGLFGLLMMLVAPGLMRMTFPMSGPTATTGPAPAPTGPPITFMAVSIASSFVGVLYAVFAIWALFLLVRYRRAFRDILDRIRLRPIARPDAFPL